METQYIELWLGTGKHLPSKASKKLRGYISSRFMDDPLFHNHSSNGAFLYHYPVVQYKIIKGHPLLIGMGQGVQSIWKVFDEVSKLTLGDSEFVIYDKKSLIKNTQFGVFGSYQHYFFLTPWLALNETNHKKYISLQSPLEKNELLKTILKGNIISMSKGLGYTVSEDLKPEFNVREVKTSLKGVPMIGFLGTFSVNFNIPDYLGIGKSVSRGFGTVKRIS